MIVYYDPNNGNILGMSYKVIPGRNNYFETDSPIAEKIFLGQEKSIRYHVVVRPEGSYIKLKQSTSLASSSIKTRIIPFSLALEHAEVVLEQDIALKKVSVRMLESSFNWWKTDVQYSLKKMHIVACKKNNPYLPMWHIDLAPDDIESLIYEIDYTGSDDITFYTTQLFDSYKHEIKSS